MTNEEIEKLIEHYRHNNQIAKEYKSFGMGNYVRVDDTKLEELLNYINQLQQENAKQKEILDILKDNIRLIDSIKMFVMGKCDKYLNKYQYDLLKEWLENGK